MARREWNVARNGQFGRQAKSAGFRRNPNNTREPAQTGKKKPQLITVGASVWWRRRELNPRPQALYSQVYMLSLTIWF